MYDDMNKSKQILGCFALVLFRVVLVLSRVVLVLPRVVSCCTHIVLCCVVLSRVVSLVAL